MTRDEVVTEARKWLRVPYRKRGRTMAGVDCIGFLSMVGRALDVPHDDRLDYEDWPRQDHLILRTLEQYLTPIPPTSIQPGSVGIFAERRLPGHCGIFSMQYNLLHLIHARINPGMVIEEAWAQMPRQELRLIGLFDFPGIT